MEVGSNTTELWKKFECKHSDLPQGDYVSPNFVVIKADPCFPNKKLGNMDNITNPDFRKHIKHNWYIDPSFPECGFLTRDEANILFNAALQFSGKPALEIGSHTGWSTVHIALSGVKLDVIEPQLTFDPRILLGIIESLRLAGASKNVNLVHGFSPEAVHELAKNQQRKWSFIFIDGNHNADYPLNDAKVCSEYAAEDCMIFFHDLAFPDVARGWRYFVGKDGWNTRIYHTQQLMGLAWRGKVTPPEHVSDPTYDWTLPQHLAEFATKN
jgi:hypothetical protein